jgi:hypothetical protein
MYGGLDAFAASFAAAASKAIAATSGSDPYAPFDMHLQWDEAAWSQTWRKLAASYAIDPQRCISRDWLNVAAELALQLDSYTNNTSLVLAFEVPGSKDVLLFVGDAQIGNWLSWSGSSTDLLSRTIFYKVGHHGSHNATLKTGGLEAMSSKNLVAAIPVDEQFAHLPKGGNPNGWDMPAGPLLSALLRQTKGRVLRGDSDFPEMGAKPDELSNTEWETFRKSVSVQPHFIDYFIA